MSGIDVGDLVKVRGARYPEKVTWTDYDEQFPIRTASGWYAPSEVSKVGTTEAVTLFRTVDEHGEAWSPSWQGNDFYLSRGEAVEAAESTNWDHPTLTVQSAAAALVWVDVHDENGAQR